MAKKTPSLEKKDTINFTTPYSNLALSALHQIKALNNFHKRGQGPKAACYFCLDKGLLTFLIFCYYNLNYVLCFDTLLILNDSQHLKEIVNIFLWTDSFLLTTVMFGIISITKHDQHHAYPHLAFPWLQLWNEQCHWPICSYLSKYSCLWCTNYIYCCTCNYFQTSCPGTESLLTHHIYSWFQWRMVLLPDPLE